MFIRPNEEQVEVAVLERGFTREEAERGYGFVDFGGTGMLEINRYDMVYLGWPENYPYVNDEDCAREAERVGFCKIIPVDELPENFERRYFGWVDTPENRKRIAEYCKMMAE